ncbi:MAG: hypothetical protein ABSA13_13125 [Beijerinckiaceae bacterium]|jgi:hypothetical protein
MMIGTSKAKSFQSLERTITKYELKVAKAASPSQRQYAVGMLRMAQGALAKAQEGSPSMESGGADVVNLRKDEYVAT